MPSLLSSLTSRESSQGNALDGRAEATIGSNDRNGGPSLRVGYLCFDFNDHPTAHLAEGLFIHHSNKTYTRRHAGTLGQQQPAAVQAFALSYGRDDGSTYRKAIQSSAHRYGNWLELYWMLSNEPDFKKRVVKLFKTSCLAPWTY